MTKPKMSNRFKKWLKICGVMYGIFLVGTVLFRGVGSTMFLLVLLAGTVLALVGVVLFWLFEKIMKVVLKIWDVATTRYVIVFKF